MKEYSTFLKSPELESHCQMLFSAILSKGDHPAGSSICKNQLEHLKRQIYSLAQSAGVVDYTDCISAEGWDRSPNECPNYDTEQSDGEVPVMLELCEMRSTPSTPMLSGPLWPRVEAPDRVLSMSQIELNCALMLAWIA